MLLISKAPSRDMLELSCEHHHVRFSGIRLSHFGSLTRGSALMGRRTETFSERCKPLYTLIVLRGVCGAAKICFYLRRRCDWQIQTAGLGRVWWGYRTKIACSDSSEHGEEARSADVLPLPRWKRQRSEFSLSGAHQALKGKAKLSPSGRTTADANLQSRCRILLGASMHFFFRTSGEGCGRMLRRKDSCKSFPLFSLWLRWRTLNRRTNFPPDGPRLGNRSRLRKFLSCRRSTRRVCSSARITSQVCKRCPFSWNPSPGSRLPRL
jgi:hypothetical protein